MRAPQFAWNLSKQLTNKSDSDTSSDVFSVPLGLAERKTELIAAKLALSYSNGKTMMS